MFTEKGQERKRGLRILLTVPPFLVEEEATIDNADLSKPTENDNPTKLL
jgi:hypothetical protein